MYLKTTVPTPTRWACLRVAALLTVGIVALVGLPAAFAGSTTTGAPFMPHGSGAARNTGDYISCAVGTPTGLNSPYRYFIEVPPGLSRLVVDIFDADVGLGGTAEAAAGRDRQNPNTSNWDTSVNYTLWNPAGTAQTTVFSQGNRTTPASSDNAWLTLYDSDVNARTFRDNFGFQLYSNSDGPNAWATNWTETGEATDPLAGIIQVRTDTGQPNFQLRFQGPTAGTQRSIERQANLAGAPSATLSLRYRRNLSSAETYRDQFDTRNYGNNNGTSAWTSSWTEVNDDGAAQSPTGGGIQIDDDISDFQLEMRRRQSTAADRQTQLWRSFSLSGATAATLTFSYRRDGMDNNTKHVYVEASTDGISYAVLQDIDGAVSTDPTYQSSSIPFTATYLGQATVYLRLRTAGLTNNNDTVWFENLQVAYTDPSTAEVTVESSNDGSTWSNLATYSGVSASDASYTTASYAIPGTLSATTRVRFRATSLGGADQVFIDDVQIYAPGPSPTPGHWELRVDHSSAATNGDDINAFGIRAHDGTPGAGGTELNVYYDSHTAYGVNDNDGAANSRTYTVYPWVTSGCTCTERDFDYDSDSGTVGSVVLYGRGGVQRANFASGVLSANNVWAANTVPRWGDNSNATDYGLWRAVASISTYTNTAGLNSNYSNIYFGNDQSAAPPPTANPTANSFRVYLPTDAGAAPVKPYLEQQVRYRSGATTVADNTETIVAVTVRLSNPTGSALTFGSPSSNAITSYIPGGQATCYQANCGAQTNYGTVSTSTVGTATTVTWAPGTVPAGATAVLGYNVRIYPTTGGTNPIPVTGTPAANGTRATYLDETGNTTQTRATVTLGPLCDLNVARGLLTEAVLSGMAAFRHRDGVLVRWETASEVGTAGFRLLRWEPSAKDFVEVGEEPAAALPEAPQGAAYEVVDRDADPRTSQIYRLMEIELSGTQRDLGTFELQPQDDTGHWAVDAVTRTPWPAQPEPPLPDLSATAGMPGTPVGAKIAVASDGLYYLSAEALAPVLGLSRAEVRARILAATLALSNKGTSIAWLPSPDGWGLYFYGRGIDNPFTSNNIYRLALARGVRMQDVATIPPSGPGQLSSQTTRHFEIDRYPVINGPLDAEGDFWFQDYLIAGDPAQGRKPATLDLPAVAMASGDAILTANLFGMSASGSPKEHHARVFVNGVQVAEEYWEGITPLAVVARVSQTLLHDGSNTIEVEALKGPGVPFSYVYIDSFDVTYERRHEAEVSALQLSIAKAQGVTVAGFADPSIRVLDTTSPSVPRLLTQVRIEPSGAAFQATFTAPRNSNSFVLAGNAGIKTPLRIWRDNPSSLRTRQNSADYVVITAPELVTAAEGLAELRRQTGLRAQVVDLEDIYDEFNSGLPSPRAIQAFLAFAKASWQPAPSLVVLAGAGTYDYRNLLGLGGNLVPPLLVSTQRGMFSSDALLADVSGAPGITGNGLLGPTTAGDGVPDLAIGRLPVTTPEELAVQVAKIAAFEQSKAGEWAGRALLVADNPDKGVDFGAENDSLAPLLPGTLAVDRAYLGPLPLAKARDVLLGQWNSGTALVNYLGHGGHDRWATEGLLVGTDVAALNNAERLPLVTSMTCVIGRFEIPGLDSLGEALVRRQGGGAIAVWAPSGMGNHPDSLMLARHFTTALSSVGSMPASDNLNPSAPASDQPTIGSAVVSALAHFAAGGGDMTTAVLYNLLGDPAVRLRPAPSPPLPPPGGGPGEE